MDKFKKPLPALLIFIFLVSIIVVFRSFLMVYIIKPIALLCWAIWRIVSSVNQNVYWIILIALCIIFMIRMIPFEDDKPSRTSYTYSYKPSARVDYWRTLIKDSALGKNEDKKLRKYLKELLITVLSQVDGISAIEVEKNVENREIFLSPSLHEYLFSSKMKGKFFQENKLNTLYFLPGWFRRWGRNFIHQDNSMIDEVLEYIETELEINDEK